MSATFDAAQRRYESREHPDFYADDRDYFQEWYDANIVPHDYENEIKAGVLSPHLEESLGDAVITRSAMTGLFSAFANGDAQAALTLGRLLLATAILKAEEYDDLLAREAFESYCEKKSRD